MAEQELQDKVAELEAALEEKLKSEKEMIEKSEKLEAELKKSKENIDVFRQLVYVPTPRTLECFRDRP